MKFPLYVRVSVLTCATVGGLMAAPVTVDFSQDSVGKAFEDGAIFPSSNKLYQYFGSPQDVPAGSSSSATIVEAADAPGGKALRLETTPKDEGAGGQPYSWVRTRDAVSLSGKSLSWEATFSMERLGIGSDLYVALVSGNASKVPALQLDQFQKLDGVLSHEPALVVGLQVMNLNENMVARIIRLGSDGDLSGLMAQGGVWEAGATPKVAIITPGEPYTIRFEYDGKAKKIAVSFFQGKNKVASGSFPLNEISSTVDVSSLRLAVGELMNNSGNDWALDLHAIEFKD